ncbi:uncharacterized protein LOC130691933 [Daphnia carinata]|uniref:uncharacterized protein LOC130691933 n=1 Tax=Daphnia carinata TaxID=120202 RepID=UPI00257F24F4|nr:uncharacterized protein LOC130691933 [Daphnia carinata]
MLRLIITLVFLCYFLAAVAGDPQRYFFPSGYQRHYLYPSPVYHNNKQQIESSYQPLGYFRSGLPLQEEDQPFVHRNPNPRLFLNLFTMSNGGSALITLTYSTSTTTKTNTITKFCTTSTAALVTCSPAGRRRRGVGRRGLYHDEDDVSENVQDIAALPTVSEQPTITATFNEDGDIKRESVGGDASAYLLPSMSGNNNGRQLISFGVSTSTVTATATYTSVIIAVCASTSGFPTCASG